MRRHRLYVAACLMLGVSCILSTACGNDETYTDNPTVDAVKIAEDARWVQTFDGGTVAYLKTAQGVDSALCIARLADGTTHNVVVPESIRCINIRQPG